MSFTKSKVILETKNLGLRPFTHSDAKFTLDLLNTPTWIKYIGDKNVHSINDAIQYLENGPIASYRNNGFGLFLVYKKTNKIPIGMCGLVRRETLLNVDIGFALMPEFSNMGYGYEIAKSTLDYAYKVLKLKKVVAITDPDNLSSIKLINKLGLEFEKTLWLGKKEKVLLFSPLKKNNEKDLIDELINAFFNIFKNHQKNKPQLDILYQICSPKAIFTNNTKGLGRVENLKEFVESREKILNNGKLTNFQEREIFGKTKVFGNLAQRYSLYEKKGFWEGKFFNETGVKTIQLIKIEKDWKILSAVWHDQ